ncbi:uncharacterized protein EI97DRAFT_368680 [Westerdykella ornata]|uniref:Uncharacterized protein n=1 Tax=Westerdykella ornata TaxID=318751 RepID=A0A6A6JWJ0_WESOR|nr:uncharacterized protein EI97DRAFT_368680 [Westerdykella ornata]KAF2280106.1 hypothetical protein EI97DRAFT_368680 [Westerdykella ornata]
MHSSEDIAPGSDLTPRLGAIDITTIWHVINAGDKYLFSDDEELADPAREFFKLWYAQNVDLDSFTPDLATTTFARQLALPCHFFDHPEAFAAITKWLAYNCVGHIQESVPVKFKFVHLHLCPPDFVGPVNHARGSLKTTLHRGLWNRVGDLLKKGSNGIACAHWAETAGRYFGALTKLEVYPLELSFSKNSINTLLGWLGDFHLNNKIIGCYSCKADWNREVKSAVYRTRGHFDGLCIDCMDKSKIKNGRNDEDYWEKLGAVDGRFDKDCRIRHADNTWWVSWCGRDEHRRKLMDEKRAQERQE